MECDQDYLSDLYIDGPLPPGQYAYLEISDNGYGMSKEVQARAFEPFFSTKFTGRGLGLAAVLGIVRGHQGTVKIYTEEGRGTTVKVLIPVLPVDPSGGVKSGAVPAAWTGSGTILVVDDEESVRNVTRAALRRAGFDVLEARDGQEALELLTAHRDTVRLVLLDVTMPRMGGEEAYRRIRQIAKDIPVILSSGYNEQDATGHFSGKGLSGFIQKPYRPSDLVAKIRQLLGDFELG
jgi:CheY-like chemotaxis protein